MKPGACCMNSKAQESVFKNVLCNPPALSEMPDVKAEDEVDFRASSISEEVAVGSIAATLKMKQGPMTQAVSGIRKSVRAQNVFILFCCVLFMALSFI